MGLQIQTESGADASISIYSAVSKKTNKPYTAISVKIGEWSTLIFPKSPFELKYLKEQLGAE